MLTSSLQNSDHLDVHDIEMPSDHQDNDSQQSPSNRLSETWLVTQLAKNRHAVKIMRPCETRAP
jgi:hypothetical protein